LGASGAAAASLVSNVGTLTSSGATAASWNARTPVAFSVAGVSAASFGVPSGVPVNESGAFSAAGTSTASWVSDVQETIADFSIWLVDSDEPVFDATNVPVYEQTAARSNVIYGAMLQYGRARPSSYHNKEIFSVRPADSLSFDESKISWDDSAVSMFSEFKRNNLEAGTVLAASNGTDSHKHDLDSSGQSVYRVIDDGGDVAYLLDGVAAENTLVTLASSAEVNDAKLVVDGGSALTDASLTMPTVTGGTILIGSGYDGIISRLMILPQTSTEEELQAFGEVTEPPTYRYIEKLSLMSEAVGGTTNKMADSGVFVAGPASSVTCAWLPERTDIIAWATNSAGLNVPLTGLTSDVSGVIELGGTYTNIWVGLGYQARYKSAKLAFANAGGTALLQRKRVAELGLLLENTHRDAVKIGEDFTRMRQMNMVRAGKVQADGTIYSTYDDKSFSVPGSWDTDSRVCLEVNAPYPATFLGLIIGLEWNERGLG
jgi:hypothetical protein